MAMRDWGDILVDCGIIILSVCGGVLIVILIYELIIRYCE